MLVRSKILRIPVFVIVLSLVGCAEPDSKSSVTLTDTNVSKSEVTRGSISCDNAEPNGTALFGDLHIHTRYSFDAAANSTGTTPEDAHRYALGEEIPIFPINSEGVVVGRTKIDRPLDFLAVTDHGEFLGERALCRTASSPVYETSFCQAYRSDERQGMVMLSTVITTETPERIPEICGRMEVSAEITRVRPGKISNQSLISLISRASLQVLLPMSIPAHLTHQIIIEM